MKNTWSMFLSVFALIIIIAGKGYAQPRVRIEHYSTEQGLSHDIVSCMFKDRQGYMWFGTWNGINRFDGQQIKSFATEGSNINNARIEQIAEDAENGLWLKCYDGEVYRFDKEKERFTSLSAILKLKNKVLFQRILSAADDKLWISTADNRLMVLIDASSKQASYQLLSTGDIVQGQKSSNAINFFYRKAPNEFYLGTSGGIIHLSGKEKVSLRKINLGQYTNDNFTGFCIRNEKIFFGSEEGNLVTLDLRSEQFSGIHLISNRINALIAAKSDGKVYISTTGGELIAFDPATNTYQKFTYPQGGLFAMFEDNSGSIWIEPEKSGVIRFDLSRREFHTYKQKNDSEKLAHKYRFHVFIDNEKRLWATLRDGGFGYYNPTSDKLEYFYNEPGSLHSKMTNLVVSSYYDPSGVMFIHTDQRGIDKVIFNPNDFRQQLFVDPGLFKSDNEVRGLMCDRRNRIWAGVRSGKLYISSNGEQVPVNFDGIPKEGLGSVYTIMQTSTGEIWLGTKDNGLFLAVPKNTSETSYQLSHFKHQPDDMSSLSSNQIYSVAEGSDGKIWIGSFDKGLNLLVRSLGKISFLRFDGKSANYPKGFQRIRHLAADRKGNIWIGSTDGLLIVNHRGNNKITYASYTKESPAGKNIGNNDVQYVLRDHSGHMWMATSGGGISSAPEQVDIDEIRIKTLTTSVGLGNNYVLSMAEDTENNIWIATKSGLSKLNAKRDKFDSFNSYDGVANDGFSEASACLSNDDKVIFGTINGMLFFNPKRIGYRPIFANMVLTNLQVNNKDIAIGGAKDILQRNIDNTRKIILKYDQNTIGIDYNVIDFRSAGRERYKYRLEGFDKDWQDNRGEHRATYTNLPAGNYLFEVKVVDRDNYINIPSKKLMITILPPPWLSWWAYLCYGIITIGLIIFSRKIILAFFRLKQEVAVEQKVTKLKTTFFTNISHELRTPLSLIINPIEDMLSKKDFPEQFRDHASIIQKNASRMVYFVNQLLDLRKSQSGQASLNTSVFRLKDFLSDIMSHFAQEAARKRISVSIDASPELFISADADKLEVVIYNLLSNAFKFSADGKQIEILAQSAKEDNLLSITIIDQGCGVPHEDLEQIFELYYESETAKNKNLKGTGIGLALVKELVVLHGGTIVAANRPGGGLLIELLLPQNFRDRRAPLQKESPGVSVAHKPTGHVPGGVKDVKSALKKPLLLLVEDNHDMVTFLTTLLIEKYEVISAVNGKQGLHKAQELHPDIIVSDIMMPEMDGIEMLGKLRNDHATSHIPMILLSAKNALESKIEGIEYGADHYIGKPFDNGLLLAAIASTLAQRKRIAEWILHDKSIVELSPGQLIVTSKDEEFIRKVVAIIEEKLPDPEFEIDFVAKTLNMSRTAFFTKFKGLTQQAPVEFIRELRLKTAKQYLDAGSGNISEVSYAVGFNNAKYFSTCFKTFYGISPSDYVKSLR